MKKQKTTFLENRTWFELWKQNVQARYSPHYVLSLRKNPFSLWNKWSEIFEATMEPGRLSKCDHNKRFTDCLHCTLISTDCDATPHGFFALHAYSPDWFLWMFLKAKSAPLVRSWLLVFTQNTVGGGTPDASHITLKLPPSVTTFLVIFRMDEGSEKIANQDWTTN